MKAIKTLQGLCIGLGVFAAFYHSPVAAFTLIVYGALLIWEEYQP